MSAPQVFADTGRPLGYYPAAPAPEAAAQSDHAAMLTALVHAGIDAPLRHPLNTGSVYPVSEYLGEAPRDTHALLFRACHLTLAGKYEAGSKALREFVQAVADRYAEEMVACEPSRGPVRMYEAPRGGK